MRCGAIWTIEGFIRGGRVGLPKVAKKARPKKTAVESIGIPPQVVEG